MVDQGLVELVQGNATVKSILGGNPAGFLFQALPNSPAYPTWVYSNVSQTLNTTLQTFKGLRTLRWQVDCLGAPSSLGVDVIALANAIEETLNGFSGILADPDSTVVSSCFVIDVRDFFNTAARSYRRMVEFEVMFSQD